MRTLDDVCAAGFDIRAWCFRCARGADRSAVGIRYVYRQRGYSLELVDVAKRFICTECRRSDAVRLFPCKPLPPVPGEAHLHVIGDIFRWNRAARKREKSARREGLRPV